MHTPTTMWDRAPTDAELNQFYGKDKGHEVHDLIVETITKTVRTVSHKALSVPYVKYSSLNSAATVAAYPLVEVFTDYVAERECIEAMMAMVEKSDCPLVAAWRSAIAARFADAHADDVEELQA